MGNLLKIITICFLCLLSGIFLGSILTNNETVYPIDIPLDLYPQFDLIQKHFVTDDRFSGNWWCYEIEDTEQGPVFLFREGFPEESTSYFFGLIKIVETTPSLPIRAYVDNLGYVIIK